MEFASVFVTSSLLIFIIINCLLIIGGIFLQIFLSKKENKWLGLILPIITFSFSILFTLIFALNLTNDSEAINTILILLTIFVFNNISTVILLAIYKACRNKFNINNNLEKMNIQDL